jgi:AraC-like DNA-binding protein
LKKAGLTFQQIEDPGLRLNVRDQINFLNLASDALQDDFLGFHLALTPDVREMGLLYYVSASSDMLNEALQRTSRYCSISNEGVSLTYIDRTDVCIKFDYLNVSRHLDRHQIEFFVTMLIRTCRQLTGLHLAPIRVRFSHRRDSCSELIRFLGRNVEFDAGFDEVAFSTDIKQIPIVSADPHLNKVLTTYCEEAISHRRTNRGSFRSSVEKAIVPLLPHGKAQAREIAGRLGLSQRTLARRLALEGLNFSSVVKSLRSDLAERYLKDENLSISQIAWLLGYQEASAFTHAFKRWTGASPRKARSLINP